MPLAKGGTARIYRLPDFSIAGEGPLVYKEYTVKTGRDAGPALLHGLLNIIGFRTGLPTDQRA